MPFQRIHIELTNRCNFSCVFCPSVLMARQPQDLDIGFVRKALDEILKEKLTDTIFFHVMGEATLYSYLEEAIRYAKNKGLKVVLTTNGWEMSSKLLEEILRVGIDHILFSVQTPDKDSFALRQAPVDFLTYRKKICSLIARIIEYGSTKVTLSFLTTPWSFFLLPSKKYRIVRNKKELISFFTDWVYEIANVVQNKGFQEKLYNKKKAFLKRLSSFRILGWNKLSITKHFTLETRVLGDWVHQSLSAEKIIKARVGFCEGLKSHFGILSNGDMVFCCVDYDGNTRFGNLKENTIKEALAQKRVQNAVQGFEKFIVKEPYCQRCLGDVSFDKALFRQLGSIVYFKIYRPWWERQRNKEEALLCA